MSAALVLPGDPAGIAVARMTAQATAASRRNSAPLLLGASIGALVAGRWEVLALSLAVVCLAARLARAGSPGLPWMRTLLSSVALAVALNLYLVPGDPLPLPVLFGTPATWDGLRQGAGFATRLVVAAVALHGLRSAWPGEQAADELADRLRALERLGVPVRRMRAVLGLAIRFVPMLRDEAVRIAAIQRLRAGSAPRGVAQRLQRARAVLIPTLVGSLERAGQVALALEARHYRLREPVRMPRAGWLFRGAGWALAGLGLLWR
ncbi:MAG: energy-coupling factor transporter transmembrane component T [Candidatus Eisenbacteria bacterium]